MVEGERREHGAVAVDLALDQERGAADAVERDDLVWLRGLRVGHIGHQGAVGGNFLVALEQDVVGLHVLGQFLGDLAIAPGVVVVGADVHGAGVGVVVALVAIGDDDGLVVAGEVLDEGGRGLDDVGVEPEDPRGAGAEGGGDEAVAGAAHGLAAGFLVGDFVALLLVLGLERRVEVLAEDGDAGEARVDGPGLGAGDGGLERGHGGIGLLGARGDEAQRDELVRVAEPDDVVPEARVEAGEGGEDEDVFTVCGGGARAGQVIEVVVHDGRRRAQAVVSDIFGLHEGLRGRRERVFGGILLPVVRRGGVWGRRCRRRGREEEEEESDGEQRGQQQRDGAGSPHGADSHGEEGSADRAGMQSGG